MPRIAVGRRFGGRWGLPGAGRLCSEWTPFAVVSRGLLGAPSVGSWHSGYNGDGKLTKI